MQVDYQIGLDDIGAFSLHHARTSKLSKRRLLSTQIMGVFSTIILSMVWPGWDNVDRIVFFVLIALLWLVGYPFYYRWAIKRNIQKIYSQTESRNVIGEHTIAIEPEYVTERSPVGESRTAWSGIEKIQSDEQYIYIYVGPLNAFVIPKRAFKSGEESEAFLQQAQAYRLAGR
jgi:hypothetical protein